jgi:spore coat protein H
MPSMRTSHVIALMLATGLSAARVPAARAQTADDLFNDKVVHEIRLTINSRSLSDMRAKYNSNEYYTADFQWRSIRLRNIGIRVRGGAGSRNPTKLGLRIDFNRYTKGQEFLGVKSIVLDNHWQDGTFMHEILAMALYARLGQPAPRISYCRLYINNESQGLYSIVESIDSKFLSRTLGENDGYLFSFQMQPQYKGEYQGRDLAPYKSMFEPQNHEKEADAILYAPIHDLFREINQPPDAVWRERVGALLDLEQFVTHAAFEAFVAEEDGINGTFGMNNFYLYRPAGSNRHRFIIWDKDSAFHTIEFSIVTRLDDYVLFQRALGFADLRERYLQTLEDAARLAAERPEVDGSVAKESWLEGEIIRIAALITREVREDTRKRFSTDEFLEALEYMKDFARRRSAFVLDEVAKARRSR